LGYKVEAQRPIKVYLKNQLIGDYYADLLIEDKVIVELKACELLMNIHSAQLMNYLKAKEIEVGLLLNFGVDAEFKRIIYTNDRKQNKKICDNLLDQYYPLANYETIYYRNINRCRQNHCLCYHCRSS
jgi:hypothetical protein